MILIDGLATPQLAKTLGVSIALNSDVIGDYYQWELLDKPEGSAAALVNPATKTPSFTPDVSGSYLLKLTINGSLEYYGIASSKSVRTEERYIAFGEGDANKGGTVAGSRGWAEALNKALRKMEALYGRGSVELCWNDSGSAISANAVVYTSGLVTKASGLSEEQDIPTVALARADQIAKTKALGVALASIANNALGLVLRQGTLTGLDTSAFAAVADPAYLSDTPGAISTTQGTNKQRIGTVVKLHATEGAIYIDPGGDEAGALLEDFASSPMETIADTFGGLGTTPSYTTFASDPTEVFGFDTEAQP